MKAVRARLTYANVVASIALVLALGGASAFAASQLGKNTVGTKQLKKDAVNGAKVRDGSLSGADIGGPVENADRAALAGRAEVADKADRAGSAAVADAATSADLAKLAEGALHASNADQLGGLPPSAFQAGGSVQRIDFSVSGCGPSGCTSPLFKANGTSLFGSCSKDDEGEVALIANAPAGTTAWQSGRFNSGETVFEELNVGTPSVLLAFGGHVQSFQGQMIFRDASHTLSLNLVMTQDNAGACQVAGTALST